jgi:hypothetical protein
MDFGRGDARRFLRGGDIRRGQRARAAGQKKTT